MKNIKSFFIIIITLFLLSCSYSEMLNIASPDREKFTYFDKLSKEKNIYLCKKRVTKKETQQASIEAHEYFSTELDEYIEEGYQKDLGEVSSSENVDKYINIISEYGKKLNNELEKKFQCTYIESIDDEIVQERFFRHVYFKMPIESIEFHWKFLDRKQLLKGKLILEFTSEGNTIKQVIFSNGELNPKWHVISDDTNKNDFSNNVIYFGFESKQKYWFIKNDSATLSFSNVNTLQGWGPDFKAQLPSGKYNSSATFTLYEDDIYENKQELLEANAFLSLEDWQQYWSLENISKPGWYVE